MDYDRLRAFLNHHLPGRAKSDLAAIVEAVRAAGRRYVRHAQSRKQWDDAQERRGPGEHKKGYLQQRRRRLGRVATLAIQLQEEISCLDSIFLEDLEFCLGAEQMKELRTSVADLGVHSRQLLEGAQEKGRARDLAQERWIHDMAIIFETNFKAPAKVWGSSEPEGKSSRGPFYDLMKLGRPNDFDRYRLLDPTQVRRILGRRRPGRILS